MEIFTGADCCVYTEQKVLKALFFQTEAMKSAARLWPEIFFIDATYKLTNINFSLMLMAVEDSDCQTRVAGACLLETEDAIVLEWCFSTFKDKNEEACANILNIMTDKDHTLRRVLRKVFPSAVLKLCLFHTQQTFGRQITTGKMHITTSERDVCLELLTKLAYSKSSDEYNFYYDKLCRKAPKLVLEYYNANWHNIVEDWVIGFMQVMTFLNYTNNRIEQLNAKVKDNVPLNSSLTNFFISFFEFLTSQNIERNAKTATNFTKTPSSATLDGDMKKFAAVLTENAMSYVKEDIRSSKYITFCGTNPQEWECSTMQNKLTITSSITECNCSRYVARRLPCKHVFATRKFYNQPLFSTSLCESRWTKQYALQGKVELTKKTQSNCSTETIENHQKSTPDVIENNIKARLQNLRYIGGESTGSNFEERANALKTLIEFWKQGLQVQVKQKSVELSAPITGTIKKTNKTQRHKILTDLANIILSAQYRTEENLVQLREIENIWKENKHVELEATSCLQTVEKVIDTGLITVDDVLTPKKVVLQGKPSRVDETYVSSKRKASSKAAPVAKRRKL